MKYTYKEKEEISEMLGDLVGLIIDVSIESISRGEIEDSPFEQIAKALELIEKNQRTKIKEAKTMREFLKIHREERE